MIDKAQLPLTTDEQQVLVELLRQSVKESRIEEHRTDAIDYRHRVKHRQDLLEAILSKLEPQ